MLIFKKDPNLKTQTKNGIGQNTRQDAKNVVMKMDLNEFWDSTLELVVVVAGLSSIIYVTYLLLG